MKIQVKLPPSHIHTHTHTHKYTQTLHGIKTFYNSNEHKSYLEYIDIKEVFNRDLKDDKVVHDLNSLFN